MAGGSNWRSVVPLRGVALFSVILFAIVLAPTRTSGLVDRAACTTSKGVLLQTVSCPLYREQAHGVSPAVTVSVSARPVGTTDDPAAYRSLASVSPGFHPLSLVVVVILVLLVATAATAIIGWLTRRGQRLPPTGAVRRRSRFG